MCWVVGVSQAEGAAARPGQLELWTTEAGEQLAFDGVFYSYRSADGLRAFKLWTPPGKGPVRALLLFGNPGGGFGGDTRDKSRQEDLLEFAAREGIAVAGVTGFPGRDVYSKLGRHILDGLAAMGARGHHPELAALPMIATGGSNAGSFSYGMLCLAPERMIGITPNVGGYHELEAPEAARSVPAWIHIGALDELSSNGVERTEALFALNGAKGPLLWAWDAEMKGHENGGADHVDFAFWEAVLEARLPVRVPAPGRPAVLRPMDRMKGWHVDHRSWDHRIVKIFPAAELPAQAEPGRYGWLPNEGLARLYQANATRSRPLQLALADKPAAPAAGTSGVYLSAGLGTLVDPGQVVRLKVTAKPLLRGITKVTIYDRGRKVAEADLSKGGECTLKIDGSKKLYALYAHAVQQSFSGELVERVSPPLQLLVRDPKASARIAAQLAPLEFAASARARAVEPVVAPVEGEIPETATLRAEAWDRAAEADLRRDGKVAPAWSRMKVPAVEVGAAHGLKTRPATGARLRVRSAWTASGLYFLQEVEDAKWSETADTESDSLDFHLASVDARRVAGRVPDVGLLAKPGATALLCAAHQIQIAVGGSAPDGSTGINFMDPWDVRRAELRPADAFGGSGYWAEVVRLENGRRAVEVFIPWHLVGRPGFTKAPAAGTRLTLALGYQDGEGGGKLAWPSARDPWHAPAAEESPAPYGQLWLMGAEDGPRL